MGLVDKNDMTTLYPASSSKSTAESAEDDIQLKAVAYAINSAANTGQMKVTFQEHLREAVKIQLKSKGYEVKPSGIAVKDSSYIISWN